MLLQQHLPFTVLKPYSYGGLLLPLVQLQQHLPFTVLKLTSPPLFKRTEYKLQQHLPFTVLKRGRAWPRDRADIHVATALTVYGIETYPLQKWTLLFSLVATALTVYGIETE